MARFPESRQVFWLECNRTLIVRPAACLVSAQEGFFLNSTVPTATLGPCNFHLCVAIDLTKITNSKHNTSTEILKSWRMNDVFLNKILKWWNNYVKKCIRSTTFILFTFKRVGWHTDKYLWANSMTTGLKSHDVVGTFLFDRWASVAWQLM